MGISLQRSKLTRSIKSLSACIWCPAVNMSSYRYQDLDREARIRYLRKLELCGLNVCPYQLPADAWRNEPTQWPNLEWPEIYDCLVNTPGIYTREAMKNRKSLEAHNQFISFTRFHEYVSNWDLIRKKIQLESISSPKWNRSKQSRGSAYPHQECHGSKWNRSRGNAAVF